MITFCSSVIIIIIIIIIHKKNKKNKNIANTKYYCNAWPLYSLHTYILSWIPIIYTQHIISTIQIIIVIQLKTHPNIKYEYCTIFHSILQYNISLHHDIYCDSGLPHYTCLITLTNDILILFSSKYNDVLFLSYNHLHIEIKNFFSLLL